LGRALVGQLIKIGYLLKVTTEPIENNRVQPIELAKEGAVYFALGNRLFPFEREISRSGLCV
jgi:hypothetical protein